VIETRSPVNEWMRLVSPDNGAGGGVSVVARDGGENTAGPWKMKDLNVDDRGFARVYERNRSGFLSTL
jgi:hypothetical protein